MGEIRIFISGKDAYALRCTYLHGGESDISAQSIQEILHDFVFLAPVSSKKGIPHCNLFNNVLQLNVKTFCLDVCDAVDEWVFCNRENTRIQESVKKMLEIHLNGASVFGGNVQFRSS